MKMEVVRLEKSQPSVLEHVVDREPESATTRRSGPGAESVADIAGDTLGGAMSRAVARRAVRGSDRRWDLRGRHRGAYAVRTSPHAPCAGDPSHSVVHLAWHSPHRLAPVTNNPLARRCRGNGGRPLSVGHGGGLVRCGARRRLATARHGESAIDNAVWRPSFRALRVLLGDPRRPSRSLLATSPDFTGDRAGREIAARSQATQERISPGSTTWIRNRPWSSVIA